MNLKVKSTIWSFVCKPSILFNECLTIFFGQSMTSRWKYANVNSAKCARDFPGNRSPNFPRTYQLCRTAFSRDFPRCGRVPRRFPRHVYIAVTILFAEWLNNIISVIVRLESGQLLFLYIFRLMIEKISNQ